MCVHKEKYSSLFSFSVINTIAKSKLCVLEVFVFYLPAFVVHYEKKSRRNSRQGRKLEVKTEVETIKDYGLLHCSPWLAQITFFSMPGPPAQGVGFAYQH